MPKVPTPARAGGGDALLRKLDPDADVLRDGGEAALGRRAVAGGGQLVGQEGREPGATPSSTGGRAMGIYAIIIRHTSAGAPHQVARWVERAHEVNSGYGWHEHPTQALLDCFTVRHVLAERKGAAPDELRHPRCFEDLRVPCFRRRRPRSCGGSLRGAGLHRPGSPRHPGRTRQPPAALARGLARPGGSRPRFAALADAGRESRSCACRRSGGAGRSFPA